MACRVCPRGPISRPRSSPSTATSVLSSSIGRISTSPSKSKASSSPRRKSAVASACSERVISDTVAPLSAVETGVSPVDGSSGVGAAASGSSRHPARRPRASGGADRCFFLRGDVASGPSASAGLVDAASSGLRLTCRGPDRRCAWTWTCLVARDARPWGGASAARPGRGLLLRRASARTTRARGSRAPRIRLRTRRSPVRRGHAPRASSTEGAVVTTHSISGASSSSSTDWLPWPSWPAREPRHGSASVAPWRA